MMWLIIKSAFEQRYHYYVEDRIHKESPDALLPPAEKLGSPAPVRMHNFSYYNEYLTAEFSHLWIVPVPPLTRFPCKSHNENHAVKEIDNFELSFQRIDNVSHELCEPPSDVASFEHYKQPSAQRSAQLCK
jgi:hypothetical protein